MMAVLTLIVLQTSGSWKKSTFKKYNFDADGIPTSGGALHPILKVREEIRSIFLEMGYVFISYCNAAVGLLFVQYAHSI